MKPRNSVLLTLVFSSLLPSAWAAAAPQLLGKFPVRNAAFLRLVPSRDQGAQELVITSFGVMGGDAISRVQFSQASLEDISSLKPMSISTKVTWPNEPVPVPEEIFGEDYLAVGTGFLVPGRSTGDVLITNLYSTEQFAISTPKSGFFYHRVEWFDMNGDGRLDAVTARGQKGMFGGSQGELLWLEQPEGDRRKPWTEHVIAKGPDVHFIITDLAGDGSPVIVATEFFSKRLTVHWREAGQWSSRLIDDKLGSPFDLLLEDLNLDGRKDLVVTNHEGGSRGAVYAYEIPESFKTQAWQRHTLLQNIRVESRGFNAAAPGAPLVWHETRGGKPSILIGGDGSCKVHMLVPASNRAADWSYEEQIILRTDSTIGRIWLGEVEGTDHLFVPSYDESKVYVFRME